MTILRTQRGGWPYSQPPNVPFVINLASPQAKGLVTWLPTLASLGNKTLRDLSGSRDRRAITGATWIASEHGFVLDYNGNHYVTLGANTGDFTDNFTITAWFRTSDTNVRPAISRRDTSLTQYDLFVHSTSKLALYDGATQHVAATDVDDGKWHLGVWAINGNDSRIYLDGVSDLVFNPTIISRPITAILGAWGGVAGAVFVGSIGDARIYNRVLSAAEARQMYDIQTRWELYKPAQRFRAAGSFLAATGGLCWGEENPTEGETPVSWQTWSDGAGGDPTIDGDADWGKLELALNEEGRSPVNDFGNASNRTYTLTENRYGAGQETATLQIRGDTSPFVQDDVLPAWENYSVPIARAWRYVQVREINDS